MLAAGKHLYSTPVHFTKTEIDITAGIPFNVTWEGANGTTTLSLQEGAANSMKTDVILTDLTNEYVLWTPYNTTTPGQYILRLDDTSNDFAHGLVFNMQSAGSDPCLASTSSASLSKPSQIQAPIVQNPSTTSTPSTSKTLGFTAKADRSKSSSTSTSTATRFATVQNSSSTSTITKSNPPIQTPDTLSSNSNSNSNSRTSSSPLASSKSTLLTMAKAGMGVGCSLAFIFLFTICLLLYRR
ncbi:hypothetical protein NA56DRAFT_278095 [Hyaloscypha hepaticicola]|uniref:Uncharacterized protein n=1 Tax=Hyaloscypha hepaticicola TaxID=2082293 RepID=A0A2J6PTL9_9HELO|nr:hypothetical protein NA56DRAFT_278095 [Hyaloscypha hepaticicola]